jgi:hypothetical protein
MIDLHIWKTPNGRKVSAMPEECGLRYSARPAVRRGMAVQA